MDLKNMHVLLTNLYLEKYQGSEINCLSLARALTEMGANVEIATFLYDQPIKTEFEKFGLNVKNVLEQDLDRKHYDLIWAHHAIVLDHLIFDLGITANKVVFSSLSPFEPFEAPPVYTNLLTLSISNSPETRRQILAENIRKDISVVFPNYISLEDYNKGRVAPVSKLKKLAIVSNHLADEIKEAYDLLRSRGIDVTIYGLGYQTVLITPEVLLEYDAIISIGKTVQYGMGLNIPVYCYDVHGGPGWLNNGNLELAFDLNFSGRGFGKKTGTQITDEIILGFDKAVAQEEGLRKFCAANCILEKNLEKILERIAASPEVDFDDLKTEFKLRDREHKALLRLYKANADMLPKLYDYERVAQELLNKEGHVELLLQSERDLMHKNNVLEGSRRELDERLKMQEHVSFQLSESLGLRDAECQQLRGKLICSEGECQQLRDKENALLAELNAVSLERDVLSDRVVKYSYNLERMREAEEELRGKLQCSEGECAQLRDKENQLLHTVSVKDEEYAALKYELACRDAECAQLRGKENQLKADLEATRNCRTWRLARVFAGFVRFFVPVGSKRALFLRLLWTFLKHPFKFLKSLSPRKMKKFFRLLRRGDVEGIKLLINSNITGIPAPSTIEVTVPEIVPVEAEPVREKTVEDYPVIHVPQWKDPQVSIVIPVYNQFEFTYHCVESIIKNSGDITYEILIANDCSTDLTTHIDEILPGVKCITNEKNLRFLLNCNNAAKHAKGQYVLFLNNDTQVQPNWLEPLVTLIESADDIGMVGSKLIYPDGLLQEAGGILWKDGSAWNFGNRQNPALPQFNYVKQVDYISGAAIMLSRALWEEIGGFDETFVPAYCEDSDLAFTVRKMGYRVMYQPLSVVVHFEGVSNGTDTSSGQKHYQVVNSKKFREKWAEELAKHPENAENVFQARDYSFGKPTLLMVDHYVPHFDKDAGSRTVYQYLKLFVQAGFNVKFIGDNFYQHEPYTTALQQMGIEVLYGPECAQHWKDWIRDNAEHIDYVFLNRPHIAPKYLHFIRENTKARIIYYGHDLAFLREMREFEITGDSSFRDSAIEWKPKELALMRAADMAYYPSYVEVDEIHAIDPTVKVKAIPAYLFENVQWEGYDHAARKDIMFIGGFGHRPNVDAVKWIADEILPELLKYLPDVKIHILGSNAPKEVLELANDHLIIEGFVTDEQLEWFYRNMRISLVPLRYGAGIKGKVVEAMRFGTPVVTTSTGAEGIPDAEKAMLIEDDGKELARKLAELYGNAEKLESMSENCIGYIQQNYSPSNAISVIGPEFGLC